MKVFGVIHIACHLPADSYQRVHVRAQVRLCLERKDFVRAQILIRKVSPRAFMERPEKKGQNTGEVGIEGTTIEAPAEVRSFNRPSAGNSAFGYEERLINLVVLFEAVWALAR